ncbi:MAG: ATP-dependent metallopeptidase FtsH/Yme1/Tma family protein, partial [Candidatus Marinimicrobia bacterium]|nr:ATP-dependent metallopeptidase FtsH/Yme1/Tma family protein [Candidatus Neomarinimicrobiota bacterium]
MTQNKKKTNKIQRPEQRNKKNVKGTNKKQTLWKSAGRNFFIWVIIIIAAFSIARFLSSETEPKSVSFTEYQEFVDNGLVTSAEVIGSTFVGTFKEPVEENFGKITRKYDKF